MLWNVFELANETAREFYLAAGAEDADEAAERLRVSPPSEIAHWSADDRISFRLIEGGFREADAEAFLAGYARTLARTSWKVLTSSRGAAV